MTTYKHVNCNLCGGREKQPFVQVACIDREDEIFSIVRCNYCGLLYLDPRPNKHAVMDYYAPDYYAWQSAGRLSIRERVKTIVMEERGHCCVKSYSFPVNILRRVIAWLFDRYVSVIVQYGRNEKVLDVGCGSGGFLKWLVDHDFKAQGVDVSFQAAERAYEKGLDVFCGELSDAKFNDNEFDTLVINQVLEHVQDPQQLLTECHRILKNGGLLIVGVPNIESYSFRVLGRYWHAIDVPKHLYYFSYTTLRIMLERVGFIIDNARTSFFFIPRVIYEDLRRLRKSENLIRYFSAIFKIFVLRFLYFLWSRDRMSGDYLTLYARKKSSKDLV